MSNKEIIETIDMLDNQNLDVRTITLSLSLLDCVGGGAEATCERVYDRIARRAENLVRVGGEIEREYGVPIVNKRVSVTPASLIGASFAAYDKNIYFKLAKTLDKAAKRVGIDFIGGFSALVHKGITEYEDAFLNALPQSIAETDLVCASVNAASTKSGVNMDAVVRLGKTVKELSRLTADRGSIGCAKFVVFANSVEDNPFMAGAYCGIGEGGATVNVGVSGPGVVKAAIEKYKNADLAQLAEVIKRTAFKITRLGQLVCETAAKRLNAGAGVIDLSLAPTPKAGDSVARILEEMGLESVGAHGTTACLALLNDAVKKGGLMAARECGGLSGAFIPVSEDEGMIAAVKRGALTIEKLEAMTCVCSVGLDMVAIPGDTPAETVSAIIADELAIGVVNNKTTAARLIPAHGLKEGAVLEFGGLLGSAPVMPVNRFSPAKFILRGGRIPAPIHSLRN
ncbi:MAG: PFL family protein [Clostridiales bacterium]|nr:PFL family protein [Clostridiales bacterium]